MDDLTKKELRKGLEQQFRFKLYQDPKFPFLASMGLKHLFQSFEAEETGYIGTLHLTWTNEDGEPSYCTKDKHYVSGFWKADWIDDPVEAIKEAIECEKKYNPYTEKLIRAHVKESEIESERLAKKMLEKRFRKDMQKAEEESKTVLWN